jgi:hypothetical protein
MFEAQVEPNASEYGYHITLNGHRLGAEFLSESDAFHVAGWLNSSGLAPGALDDILAVLMREAATPAGEGGAASVEPAVPPVDLLATMDAKVWADEFVRLFGGDHALMLAWFANAIMVGYDKGRQKADAVELPVLGTISGSFTRPPGETLDTSPDQLSMQEALAAYDTLAHSYIAGASPGEGIALLLRRILERRRS